MSETHKQNDAKISVSNVITLHKGSDGILSTLDPIGDMGNEVRKLMIQHKELGITPHKGDSDKDDRGVMLVVAEEGKPYVKALLTGEITDNKLIIQKAFDPSQRNNPKQSVIELEKPLTLELANNGEKTTIARENINKIQDFLKDNLGIAQNNNSKYDALLNDERYKKVPPQGYEGVQNTPPVNTPPTPSKSRT
jgi:hypothetical protein